MTVYRSPDCSCRHLWADIARRVGWTVANADKLDMATFKAEVGVPMEAASCHTTLVGGYLVEGHVPLEAVERLLAERPAMDGIALPGMPPGSPGMAGTKGGRSRSSPSRVEWQPSSDPTDRVGRRHGHAFGRLARDHSSVTSQSSGPDAAIKLLGHGLMLTATADEVAPA